MGGLPVPGHIHVTYRTAQNMLAKPKMSCPNALFPQIVVQYNAAECHAPLNSIVTPLRSVQADTQFERRRTASHQELADEADFPDEERMVVTREDKPPDPPLPTDMERPVCSTRDRQAMAGAPPCRDPDSTVPPTDGNAKVRDASCTCMGVAHATC